MDQTSTKLLWLLILISFDRLVVCGSQSLGNQSSTICDRRGDNGEDDPCLNYRCGAYSLASPLHPFINCALDSTDQADTPRLFLVAGVSCAYNPRRESVKEYISNNTQEQPMMWDAQDLLNCVERNRTVETQVATNETINENITGILNTATRGLEKDKPGDSLKIPQNIQIRIYAIDDDQEFRYRSHPCNIIAPVFGVIPNFTFGRWTIPNAPTLEFVWNATAIRQNNRGGLWWERITCGGTDSKNATLELWIPNKFLETTTILGPKYDYTLAIEVNGDLVDTTNITTVGNATANETYQRLLTQRPPQKLTVWNDGIGTEVIVSINSSSIVNETDGNSRLEFYDRSLNGIVEVLTDSNVQGLVQLNGSNTRASMVTETAADVAIEAIGFRQVVSVDGQYDKITVADSSIYVFTTDKCSNANLENGGYCTTVESNFTWNRTTPNGIKLLPPRARLPRSCLVPTKVFEYNCNPLSSGAESTFSFLTVASSLLVWVVVKMMV